MSIQIVDKTTKELLRAIIDTTHICIAHLDRDMNFMLVNKAYADLENNIPEFFVGKNHFDLYPNQENEAIFRNAIETGESYTATAKPFEYAHNPERGVTHWDWTITPVRDNSDAVCGLVLTLLNVTERINALEKAQLHEEELERINAQQDEIIKRRTIELENERNFIDTILETQGAFLAVLNNYGYPVLCNYACAIQMGYSKQEITSKPLWETLIPVEEKPHFIKSFKKLVSTASPSRLEYHWLDKNGKRHLIDWSNSVIKDNKGNVTHVVMTGIDITEKRNTELLLKRAAGNLEVAQRLTKIGAWEYDVATKTLWWSDEYYAILDLVPGSLVPSLDLYLQYVHEEDLIKAKLAAEQLTIKGYKDINLRIVTPEGNTRIVHEIAQVEYNKHGQPIMLRGTIQDITDITKAEAERNQLQRQLQQAHKMESIGQLTGGIAHDFNNILAAILGFTRLAMARFAPQCEGTLAEYLQEIEKAGQRASSLVKQMLAFSRGDTQDFSILDPLPIVKESVAMLRSMIPSSITLHTDFKAKDHLIETNALQLQQAVINLIINSRDALNSDKGDIFVRIKPINKNTTECTSCHKIFSGDYLAISVKDNGCGIRPDLLPRIFEPFFTTKDVGDGTGMGLAMVHGFLHSSGGHVEVDLKNDRGTELTLYFPVTSKDESNSAVSIENDTTETVQITSPKFNILVVDDEYSVVKYLNEFLGINNYRVDGTTSSTEALSLIMAHPEKYDLIITDHAMPELTGEDLVRELKRASIYLPVILCSGYNDVITNNGNDNADGADFYLAKPINQPILLQAIERLLEKYNKL